MELNVIQGNDNNNILIGTPGDDLIEGFGGEDVLFGFAGEDVLNGQDDNDILIGGDNDDTLHGGSGDDILLGGKGSDTIFGDEGDDRIIWNNGDGSDRIDGGSDPELLLHEENDFQEFDIVEVNGDFDQGDKFQVNVGVNEVLFERTNLGLFELDISNVEMMEVNGGGGNDILTVGDLSGTSLRSITFNGGDGNDVLDVSNATAEFIGFGGGYDGFGGIGNDVLIGGDGEETFEGGDDNDILFGGKESDDLTGGTGNDVLVGGGGGDTFRFFSDLLDGLENIDTILDFQSEDTLDFFTDFLGVGGMIDFIRFTPGFLQIDLSGEDVVNVFGSRSALNAAEAQLINQIENFDIFP